MGRGIVVQLESTVFCSKLCPQPGNALQQSSDIFNVEKNIDLLARIIHESHAVRKKKKCDQHSSDLGLVQTKFLGLGGDFELIIKIMLIHDFNGGMWSLI
jgi:hypothetical protein